MRYVPVLIAPIFMLADYFLTLAGVALREKKYSGHFRSEQHELNPVWQRDIQRRKWFNPKHIALTAIITLLFLLLAQSDDSTDPLVEGFFGFFLTSYGTIIGRHLSGLAICRCMMRKPDDISGQVTIAYPLQLSMSACQLIVVLIPLLLITVFSPSGFVVGGCMGVGALLVVHRAWLWRYNRKKRLTNKKDATESDTSVSTAT